MIIISLRSLIKIMCLVNMRHKPPGYIAAFLWSTLKTMNTVLHQSYSPSYHKSIDQPSVWSRFITWCNGQEENRFMWLAAGLTGHGCFLTPVTLMAVMLSGNSMFLWALVIAAMTMTLVTNLAALPAKITVPVFFLSILIDLGIILGCIITPLTITV